MAGPKPEGHGSTRRRKMATDAQSTMTGPSHSMRSARSTMANPAYRPFSLDQLDVAAGEQAPHLGRGTGDYTAAVAEIGPTGKVTAIQIMQACRRRRVPR